MWLNTLSRKTREKLKIYGFTTILLLPILGVMISRWVVEDTQRKLEKVLTGKWLFPIWNQPGPNEYYREFYETASTLSHPKNEATYQFLNKNWEEVTVLIKVFVDTDTVLQVSEWCSIQVIEVRLDEKQPLGDTIRNYTFNYEMLKDERWFQQFVWKIANNIMNYYPELPQAAWEVTVDKYGTAWNSSIYHIKEVIEWLSQSSVEGSTSGSGSIE